MRLRAATPNTTVKLILCMTSPSPRIADGWVECVPASGDEFLKWLQRPPRPHAKAEVAAEPSTQPPGDAMLHMQPLHMQPGSLFAIRR